MKKLRYIILIILFTIFSMISIIVFSNLTIIVNHVFKDIVKANIRVENIRLDGFNVIGENVTINTLDNKPITKIEEVKFILSPLAITKLRNVSINRGHILVSFDKNGKMNLENIFSFSDSQESKLKPNVYTTSIGRVDINDVDVTYETFEYDKPIKINTYSTSGYLDISNEKQFIIKVEGKTHSIDNKLNGKVGFKYDYLTNNMNVSIDNVHLKSDVLQYASLDFLDSEDFNASGYINLDLSTKDYKTDIKLSGFAYKFKYLDYDRILDKVKFDMAFKDDILNLDANSKINEKDVKLNINFKLNDILDIKLNLEDMPYEEIKKYNLVKKYNIDINSNINLDANFIFNMKNTVELNDLSVNLSTKKLEYKNFIFKDLKAFLGSKNFNIKSKLISNLESYNIDNEISVDADFDLFNLKGNIKSFIKNNTEIEKLKEMHLNIEVDTLKNISANLSNNYLNANFKYELGEKNHTLNLILNDGKNNIILTGNTNKNTYEHKYNISVNYYDNKLKFDLSGKEKEINIKTKLEILNLSRNDIYLYGANIEGDIKNILSKNRKANLDVNVSELWYKYQRLNNVSFKVDYENEIIKLLEIKNENLKANVLYNLKDKLLDIDLNLDNYMVYTTNKYVDVNLLLSKLNLKAKGNFENFKIVSKLEKSDLVINGENVGKLEYDIKTENSNIILNSRLNEKPISTFEYNQKNKNIKLDLILKEELQNLIKMKKINANLDVEAKLEGKIDSINGNIKIDTKNIFYDKFRSPNLKLDADLYKINLFSNDIDGIIDIKEFSILTASKNEKIYTLKEKIDMSKLDVDIKVENKIYDLANISKDLKGKIEISGFLKLNRKEVYANINLDSKKIIIGDNVFTNLILLAQVDKNGFDIGKGYVEYEKNPLLVYGYMFFNPFTYNLRMLAQDFNIDFLNLNKKISNANGKVNININLEPDKVSGDINVNKLSMKTNNIDIKDLDINVLLLNNKIKIEKISSIINGGLFNLVGDIEIPKIDKEIVLNKKINLNNINLRMTTNKVNLKYKSNNMLISSIIDVKKDLLAGAIDIQGGNINNIDFIVSNKKSGTDGYFISIIKEMLYNTLEDYEVKLDINIIKNLNINIANYLVIQKIKGGIIGNIKLNVKELKPYIIGKINLVDGSYMFNTNLFNIDRFVVSLDGSSKINPHIELISSTTKNNEKINISIDSKLEDIKINLSSDTNKTREKIVNELTLNTSKNNVGKDLINFATTTAVNQLLNTVTIPLERTLGLTKLELNTNNMEISSLEASRIFKNINANLFIQGKVYNDLYWNFRTSIPFDTGSNAIHYNLGLAYGLRGNFNTEFGINIDTYPNGKKDVGAYLGISYKKDMLYLLDLFKKK